MKDNKGLNTNHGHQRRSISNGVNKFDKLAIGLLFCLVILYFWRALFLKGFFYLSDFINTLYATRLYFSSNIKNGFLPLWTPNLYCGFPFFADGYAAVFYPFNILFLLLPTHMAINYFVILHFFLAAAFMYAFARAIELDRTSSLISALAFAFSSFFIAYHMYLTQSASAVWLPIIFCFFVLALKKKRPVYLLLGGVAIGFQLLAGYPQFTFFTLLIILLFIFIRGEKTYWSRAILTLLAMSLIGLGLAAIQIIPLSELLLHSQRVKGLDFRSATVGSLFPQHLFTFVWPNFLGLDNNQTYLIRGPGEDYPDCVVGYLGVIPLLFVAFFLSYRKNKIPFFFFGIALLSLLLSFGQHLPFYRILLHLPILNMFRYPVRFLFLYVFSVAMLAGVGCHYLLNISRKENRLVNFCTKYGSKILLLTILLLILLGLIYFKALFNLFIPAFRNTSLPQEVYVEKVKSLHQMRAIDFVVFASSLIIGLYLIISYLRRAISKTFFKISIMVALCLNLLVFGAKAPPLMKGKDFLAKPSTVRFLEKDKSIFRIQSQWWHLIPDDFYVPFANSVPKYLLTKKLIGGDRALIHNFSIPESVGQSFVISRIHDLLTKIGISNKRLSDLLNVKYILTTEEINEPDLLPIFNEEDVKIYQNMDCLERAFIVHRAEVIRSEESILKRLKSPDFDFRNTVIIEEEPEFPLPRPSEAITKDFVRITHYSPHEVTVIAKTDQAGFLVLTDTNYPGWKVYVDGKEDKIYQADYAFRGVLLPPGEHSVNFVYQSASFKVGSIVSILTACLLVTAGVVSRLVNRRRLK